MTKFFEFNQNNSGGHFVYDEDNGITHIVIIEAEDAEQATITAEKIGLYFDGLGDCPCCGERWSPLWYDEKGTDTPTVYGQPVNEYTSSITWMEPGREIVVHFMDGRKEWFGVAKKIKETKPKRIKGKQKLLTS
jgi:hypothetical protein